MAEFDRRRFLGSLTALAAAGCQTADGLRLEGSSCGASGVTPLEPVVRARPHGPALCIDAHAHFFNATDIQVAGYLTGPVAHSMPEWERRLIAAAAPIMQWLGHRFPPTAKDELRSLCARVTAVRPAAFGDPSSALRQEMEAERVAYRRRLAETLRETIGRETRFRLLYEQQLRRNFDARRSMLLRRGLTTDAAALTAPVDPLGDEAIFNALQNSGIPRDPVLQMVDREIDPDARSPEGVLAFLGCMLSPRHHNLMQYAQSFSSDAGAFGVDACIAAMVDFDRWLGKQPTPSSLRDQVLIHEQLAVLSGGYMLPLVAYNPWVDIADQDASLDIVEWAVKEHGCVGAKIYPPIGYSPAGNASLPSGALLPRPDNKLLDQKLHAFYRKCLELDIVVMAHAAESMGRDDNHDAVGAPARWQDALRLPNVAGLRVNAGHFGGDGDKSSAAPSHWTHSFAEAMRIEEAGGLYADLAYWTDLRDPALGAQARLRDVVAMPASHGHSVADRIMFGTDWFMMSTQNDWPSYPADVASFVATLTSVPQFGDKTFYRNIARCYGLGKRGEFRGRNRERLEAFYASWKIPAPKWMAKLDAAL